MYHCAKIHSFSRTEIPIFYYELISTTDPAMNQDYYENILAEWDALFLFDNNKAYESTKKDTDELTKTEDASTWSS